MTGHLTRLQEIALAAHGAHNGAKFDPGNFQPALDIPVGWVAGWVGSTYVGCSPDGTTYIRRPKDDDQAAKDADPLRDQP